MLVGSRKSSAVVGILGKDVCRVEAHSGSPLAQNNALQWTSRNSRYTPSRRSFLLGLVQHSKLSGCMPCKAVAIRPSLSKRRDLVPLQAVNCHTASACNSSTRRSNYKVSNVVLVFREPKHKRQEVNREGESIGLACTLVRVFCVCFCREHSTQEGFLVHLLRQFSIGHS